MGIRNALFGATFQSTWNSLLGKAGLRKAAAAPSSGVLTPISLTPVPGQAFSTALTGGTGSITATATSSDGVTLTCSGTGASITLTGTWPLSASGTNPTITITPSTGAATVIPFGVATLMDPSTIPSVPTLADWMRADTGVTTSSGLVTAVNSRVGGGAYTGPTSHQPTLVSSVAALNNQPAISFNGTTGILSGNAPTQAALTSSPGATLSAVFLPAASVSASAQLIDLLTGSGNGLRANLGVQATNSIQCNARTTDAQGSSSGSNTANGVIAASTAYTLIGEINSPAGTGLVRLNGTQEVTGTVTAGATFPATNSTYTSIGGGISSGPAYSALFNGDIAETRVFRGVLTLAQMEMLEGYDAWRYGLSLTSGHPFQTYPPTLLGLSQLTATHAVAYSGQISGLPSAATGVTATSSTGETLTVIGQVVTGTFTAAGTSTITLAATYNGVALTGSVPVAVAP